MLKVTCRIQQLPVIPGYCLYLGMKKLLLHLVVFLFPLVVSAQSLPAYILYNAKGKKVSFKKMIATLAQSDIVFIGESHNNPISHWMELEITRACKEQRTLTLGAEMFEQDNQEALDLYLQGKISAKGLDSMARLWKNYSTDYAPLVNFAKEHAIRFAATNIPRRYASAVSKGGFAVFDTLSAKARGWIAPAPILYDSTLPGYQGMLTMMAGHGSPNMVRAQASKDATMAHFILQNFVPGNLFIHYNGSYHSDNHSGKPGGLDGIPWYIHQQKPALKIATVTTVSQKEVGKLLAEHKYKADFIICVDEDMTTTY